MSWYSIHHARWHGRACAALGLVSVLLLAACASSRAAAHESIVVDSRAMAQAEAEERKRELEEMRDVNADARRNAPQLRRRIDLLRAEIIGRGLLLTLDDVLFAGNSARLNASGSERLDQLLGFLEGCPRRHALNESSVVCKASAGYDAGLSRHRAAAVMSYLLARGIAARLSAQLNESASVNDDCDAHSLYRNRPVMVLIEDVITSGVQP